MQLPSSSWMRSLALVAALAFCSFVAVLAGAQQQAPAPPAKSQDTLTAEDFPQTPEERMKRFDLPEDPGLDPEPNRIFIRYGKQYQILKFERRWAKMEIGRPGWVRPFGGANVEKELYRVDPQWVWVFHEVPVEPQPTPTPSRVDEDGEFIQNQEYREEAIKYFRDIRPEFAVLEPPQSNVTLAFENSSEGLPAEGSWRNTIDVADMNGDGFMDIIAPPQRGPGGSPAIFLGDGTGKWTRWKTSFGKFLNYGSVVAGDINGDKINDIVVGAHLSGVFAFIGDGKGNFTESSAGLPMRFGTRRVVLTDMDRDGDLDIIAISEGPMMQPREANAPANDSRLKAFRNDGKGAKWTEVNIADEHRLVAGDFLSTGDFNGDRYPDFIGASIYYDGPDILYVSNGKKGWDPVGRGTVIPFLSIYGATGAGKFSSKKQDDAIVAFSRGWPAQVDPALVEPPEVKQLLGLERISFKGKEAVRTPIVRYSGDNRIWGVAVADFDGDRNQDIAYTMMNPREIRILLGDGKGGFSQATVKAEGLLQNVNYDLRAADVNKDGRPDLVILYESSEVMATRGKNGAIQVFLNRGKTPSAMAEKASK